MKYSVSAIVLGFFAALNVAAPAPDGPGPGQVTISGISYGGSGCKAGTASVDHSQDWQTIIFSFDDFEATIGPGSKFADQVKNCNFNIQVNYPSGYQYTLYKADYTGYARLDSGVTAKQTSSYWFAGFISDKPTFQSTWSGPYGSSYTFTNTLPSTFWSPCGASTTLNINTQVVLTSNNPQAHGQVNPTSILGPNGDRHVYGVNWRRC
ncbi:hypothetical protein B9Z19DRAFT_1095732 [Tuber borchii]|uniref:Secreted protein n=1 Tax=Tuber borchii TaxID=42251 RepID=A0A2T6ZCB1_TUBBO|nr:hypothetical protein B9Z19DRAFT_1095732 [Tuber borchii]